MRKKKFPTGKQRGKVSDVGVGSMPERAQTKGFTGDLQE